MIKNKLLKKVATFALAGAMITGMVMNVSAGFAEMEDRFKPFGGPVGYYEAYCGYSDGYASTVVYLDSYTTEAIARVNMSLYSIDAYFYENMTTGNKDAECELVDTESMCDYTYNAMAEAYIELGGAVYSKEGRNFHAYKVESHHEVEADVEQAASDCIGDDLVARY